MSWKTICLSAAAISVSASMSIAQTEIQWWHAMGGTNGERVDKIAADFNASQSDYKIVPSYKGNYTETMTAAVAAFRAKEHPHLVQVFEVGTATMMAAKGAIYPVEQMMNDAGEPFEKADFLPAVISYYQTSDGELLSMPFNSSTPVLWYNVDAINAAGVKAPKTWGDVKTVAQALVDNGMECGLSFGWQSWVMIENFSAWHNLAVGTEENGFAGFDTKFTFNNDRVAARLDDIASMSEGNLFKYGGRRGDSLPMFTNGECGMWINSSAYYGSIKSQAKFKFAQTMLPLDTTITETPQNSIIGGATLWVLSGHESDEYKGLAKFMTYLSSADVQAWWHQETGYVPITTAAYELSNEQGFYDSNPGTDTAIQQLSLNTPTANSRGVRFGNFVQVRDVINEEMEAIWAGDKTAKEALDAAAKRGDALLRKFERSVK
ncbi:MAG: sn-glycerol-3-phosphate ABC transporter substrate-binding protein UgpB [Tateyamaria sp.]|jgi:sn-glycerol 3-phosphate transport system substrate-binding protein|nr:sn-glycerol-3-phosphate ABC transporter substrate-binding protein UgpB [Tateyamaria sp.]MBT5302794.1 sn-glycerol-3-phosphate ABC transporter substrate-binding protein UgpB [Tateyamaria sp.]MBT6266167.1 sn-glycerol-3-phosphate ABC transporter substrate-binding protein UgpB [Tateyamaria sp.]MBT6344702.1 sn-glycerol-3-phosphate ABC transporter substrate-binding protein UgpB [Tateyamaria sp.]MBT7447710.1 sn-glycerol-3-phosphate ABC transporter substrate-binding protein UgpB [Tateyamaria sp.]